MADEEFESLHAGAWRERQQEYRGWLLEQGGDGGCFAYVTAAVGGLTWNREMVRQALDDLRALKQDSDMRSLQLVRLLYLGTPDRDDDSSAVQILSPREREEIVATLLNVPFWPSTPDRMRGLESKRLVFWSENHILMSLGTAHLARQMQAIALAKARAVSPAGWKEVVEGEMSALVDSIPGAQLEEKLLRRYIAGHVTPQFTGVYETLSHVYLPYSLSALFNIFDFSLDNALRADCASLIDAIIKSVLLTTAHSGVATLTASCRAFDRTRRRNHDHNINNLTRMLVGVSPEAYFFPSALTDFLCTTTWRPSQQLLAYHSLTGRVLLPCSPSPEDFFPAYRGLDGKDDNVLSELEMTPFAWSAGLVVHPLFAKQTKKYLAAKHMELNDTMSALRFVPRGAAASVASSLSHLSMGQMYCGVALSVFKSAPTAAGGQLVLSSFVRWNAQAAGFQQLPWCLNLADVGVWTQSGAGSEGFLGFSLTNTHNPCVAQEGSALVCSYVAPKHLLSAMSLSRAVLKFGAESWLVWPDCVCDEAASFPPTAEQASGVSGKKAETGARGWGWLGLQQPQQQQLSGAPPMTWRVVLRRGCFAAVACTGASEECRRHFDDTRVEVPLPIEAAATAVPSSHTYTAVQFTRLICRAPAHSWILLVGLQSDECPDAESFYQQRCCAAKVTEQREGSIYSCAVEDEVEGVVSVVL